MSAEPVIDAELVTDEPHRELVVHTPAPTTLFHTNDPAEVLDRASRVAQALKTVIEKQGLVSKIQGREHVRVEGWTTLGSMLGVVPVVEWTRRTDDGWEARVEARTLDGRVIGAAEAMCSKAEGKPWDKRPDYALRSMAQTRATSKALRGPLGFVVTLAGFDATPSEEMPGEPHDHGRDAEASPDLKRLVRDVLTFLLEGNEAAVGEAAAGLSTQFEARLPASAGQAIVLVGSAVKRFREQGPPARESDVPDGFPRQPSIEADDDDPFNQPPMEVGPS